MGSGATVETARANAQSRLARTCEQAAPCTVTSPSNLAVGPHAPAIADSPIKPCHVHRMRTGACCAACARSGKVRDSEIVPSAVPEGITLTALEAADGPAAVGPCSGCAFAPWRSAVMRRLREEGVHGAVSADTQTVRSLRLRSPNTRSMPAVPATQRVCNSRMSAGISAAKALLAGRASAAIVSRRLALGGIVERAMV